MNHFQKQWFFLPAYFAQKMFMHQANCAIIQVYMHISNDHHKVWSHSHLVICNDADAMRIALMPILMSMHTVYLCYLLPIRERSTSINL